ncbi:MAG: hypothetical protein WA542_09035 [Candidatus Acidiferrum sp.]
MAVHPDVLQVFGGLLVAPAPNMPLMLRLASLPKRVLRGVRTNAYSALAKLSRAGASHHRVQPPMPFFITPTHAPSPNQTYVLATVYV